LKWVMIEVTIPKILLKTAWFSQELNCTIFKYRQVFLCCYLFLACIDGNQLTHYCTLVECSLNAGLHTCRGGALPPEPHLQSIMLWLFWRWGFGEQVARAGLKLQISLSLSP
jgi:hypothetical protein